MELQNGINKILFSDGKLFLNSIQIGGKDIIPNKDIVFEFHVKKHEKVVDSSILEINVYDSVAAQALGPGQK